MNIKILMGILIVLVAIPVAFSETTATKTILPINNTLSTASADLPKVQYTPDQPLYGLERFGEKLNLWFTFNKTSKLKLSMHYAELRLAEANLMIQKNKTKYVSNLLNEYESQWNKSTGQVREMYDNCMTAQKGVCNNLNLTQKCNELNLPEEKCSNLTNVCENVAEKRCEHFANMTENVMNATGKHIAVLQNVLSKVPGQAKQAIQHAIEASQQGHNMLSEKVRNIVKLKHELTNRYQAQASNGGNDFMGNENQTGSQGSNQIGNQNGNQTVMQNTTHNDGNARNSSNGIPSNWMN